ncbi:MAG: QueT transporter family protein [Clostridia bacterium]|nr:QueT transporter family protein [Clostridia bacterium]
MQKKFPSKGLVLTGLIASLYVVLTLPFGQIAFGPIQFRIAEVLTLLPFFTPWAIPGVTIGCLLSNLLFSTIWDALFGTLATLIAAWFTYRSRHLLAAPVWPILFNGLIIGTMLTFIIAGQLEWGVWLTMTAEVTVSEFIVCFAIGIPFMRTIQHYNLQRFFKV